jgi:O-antigen/teichoic acid export membrane protein
VTMMGATEAISYRAARPDTKRPVLAGTLLWLSIAQSGLLVVIGVPLLPLILSGYGTTTVVASLLCLASFCVATPALYAASMLNGTRHFTTFNALRVLVVALRVVALVAIVAVDELTVTTAVLTYFVGIVPTLAGSLVAIRRVSGGIARPDLGLARSLAWFGWRTQLSSVRNPLNEQLDQLVISLFLAPVQLGLYAVAFTVTSVIGLLSGTIAIVALPGTARNVDPGASATAARRYLSLTFFSSVVVAAVLIAIATPLIDVVFGTEFGDAVGVTRILLVAAVFTALTRVGASVLNGLGRPGEAGIAGVLSLGGMAIGIAALLPWLGIEGAAIGTLAGYALSGGWCLLRLGRALGTSPRRLLTPLYGSRAS